MGPSLPPELVNLTVQHLPRHDKETLKYCALVARTWSSPSQRALFHDIVLSDYPTTTKLLAHLICFPHLQTLVRGLTIYQCLPNDAIPLSTHVSCLSSVLRLLPNLTKFTFKDLTDGYDIVATRSYLDLIPNVLETAPLVELDIDVFFIESFQRIFEILEGTNIKQVSLSGFLDAHEVDPGAPRKRLHLPSLEHIRFGVDGLPDEFHNCLTHNFDLPNLKECEIFTESANGLINWQNILHQGFLPLEVFKLELESGFWWINNLEEDAYHPLPLAGLPFQQVHLSVNPVDLDATSKFIQWWSFTFRTLSDSKAKIHFTELTFTFWDLPGIETLEEAWSSLDEGLAHTTFSSVRSIHFKRNFLRTQDKVTRAAYPILADKIQRALPRLASRGVLRFD